MSQTAYELYQPGMNEEQVALADEYANSTRVEVDDTGHHYDEEEGDIWTFTLDGVRFAVKASIGERRSRYTVYPWREEGFKFIYYNGGSDRTDRITIKRDNEPRL